MRPVDIATPVLILGFRDSNGLGIARSLGRLGVSVFAVTEETASAALASRYLSGTAVWNLQQTQSDVSIDFLLHLAQRNGGRMVLVPASDRAASFVAQHAASLSQRFLFPRLPAGIVHSLTISSTLHALARKFDIPVDSGAQDGNGQVWLFTGYFDRASRCRVAFTGRQLHGRSRRTGATSLGISLENNTLAQLTIDFLQRIRYRGLVDVSWVLDGDGRYKLRHVAPRVDTHFRLFLGTDEMDVIRYFYLDQTGQPLPTSMMREGRKWLAEDGELDALLRSPLKRTLSLSSWLQAYRGVEECAWFARDDWRPFWRRIGSLAKRAFRQPWPAASGRSPHATTAHEREPQRVLAPSAVATDASGYEDDWRASRG